MLKNHAEVEMVGYSPLTFTSASEDGSDLVESQRQMKKKRCSNMFLNAALIFLCISQSLQWALLVKTAFVVQSPLQQAINIMTFVDTPKFYDSLTNAQNIAKQVDTADFYSSLNSTKQTIVPALEKTLPMLTAHINTPQFYEAFDQLEDQVIPEIVKLIPTFNRLPAFINETEILIKIAEAILRRWNFTFAEFYEKKIYKKDDVGPDCK